VAENPRIEELRRRVDRDPASIAFAQLAEEHRRAGSYEEAVRVCRAGLAQYPAYLSARVTLGRALLELERFDEARAELEHVLRSAPDNLAAIRALAEIHQRRGDLDEALRQFGTAHAIARDEALPPLPDAPADRPPAPDLDALAPPRDLVLEELEWWLDAILADRRVRANA
jgi:tetratricopeptide (TPR) repeat protein